LRIQAPHQSAGGLYSCTQRNLGSEVGKILTKRIKSI
jgi:hypothetical protein